MHLRYHVNMSTQTVYATVTSNFVAYKHVTHPHSKCAMVHLCWPLNPWHIAHAGLLRYCRSMRLTALATMKSIGPGGFAATMGRHGSTYPTARSAAATPMPFPGTLSFVACCLQKRLPHSLTPPPPLKSDPLQTPFQLKCL